MPSSAWFDSKGSANMGMAQGKQTRFASMSWWVRVPPSPPIWKVNRTGAPGLPRKQCGPKGLGFETSAFLHDFFVSHNSLLWLTKKTLRRNPAGAGRRFESGWDRKVWGSRPLCAARW